MNDEKFDEFQIAGSAFLASHPLCILGDDPRLGKTRQTIRALHLLFGEENLMTILITCPAGVRMEWFKEFRNISPAMAKRVRILSEMWQQPRRFMINICSFEYATTWVKELCDFGWQAVIVDEAHRLMNDEAQRTQAFYGSFGKSGGIVEGVPHVKLLSGTIMPKHPADLYTHFRRLFPELIKTADGKVAGYWKFFHTFCNAIKVYRNKKDELLQNERFEWKVISGKNLPALKDKLNAVMLRRTQKEIFGDRLVTRFTDLLVDGVTPDFERRMTAEQIENLLAAADRGDDEEKSFAVWRHEVGLAKVKPVSTYVAGRLEDGLKKIIIFAWHRDVIQAYADELKEFKPLVILGGMGDAVREAAKLAFQKDDASRVVVAQMIAAGEGIDLSAADESIIAESSSVPKDNIQAANRMVNIMKSGILLARFAVLEGSIDESIQATRLRRVNDLDYLFNQPKEKKNAAAYF